MQLTNDYQKQIELKNQARKRADVRKQYAKLNREKAASQRQKSNATRNNIRPKHAITTTTTTTGSILNAATSINAPSALRTTGKLRN